MLDQVEIVDTDYSNVDTRGLCGANRLGLKRKRDWIRRCLPYGLRYKTLRERAGARKRCDCSTGWRRT